jgi:FG-GAP repeat/FG-GAP-like repeat
VRRFFVTVAAAAVGVTVVPLASAQAAAPTVAYKGANSAIVQDDFNGDGYRDLAVGAPSAAYGSVESAGAVVVLYGSASGTSGSRRTVVTQASEGVPGAPEVWDQFGAATASADLDGDGYADLIVGTPSEGVGDTAGRGTVNVIWGGPDGLSGGATLSAPSGYGAGQPSCGFGGSLAVGDVNGDGAPDIAVGSRCAGVVYTGPFTRTGQAAAVRLATATGESNGVVIGDVDGDGKAELFWLIGHMSGDIRGPVYTDDGTGSRFGISRLPLVHGLIGQIGDVNGDGYGDLVTGSYDDTATDPSAAHVGGEIEVLYGGPDGITSAQSPQVLSQDTADVPGAGERGDGFGWALSIGDADGDGTADVLVGAPGEAIGTAADAGMVTLLRGSAAGLTGTGSVAWEQNTADVPGAAEQGDAFGAAVHLADLTGDGRAEVVVGIPGEDTAGCIWTARGGAAGPSAVGSTTVSGPTAGVTSLDAAQPGLGASFTSPHTAE